MIITDAATAAGAFSKKHQRQPAASAIKPPIVGPESCATVAVPMNRAMYLPRPDGRKGSGVMGG